MWLRTLAVTAWGLAGCRFDAEPGDSQFACTAAEPSCPEGLVCADGRCRDPGMIDAGGAVDGATASAYAAAVLADGPILYLRLDDQDNSARDSSPAQNDGIYLGGVTHLATGALAEANGAASFDGDNDEIDVNDSAALRLNGDFTIELWARAAATELAYPGVVRKGDPTFAGTGYLIYYRGTAINNLVFKRDGHDDLCADMTPLSFDVFHHYALVHRQSEKTLTWYADGEEDTAYTDITFSVDDDDGDLSFAQGDSFGAEALDEIAFYDRALTRERLLAHLDAAVRVSTLPSK